MFSYPSKIFLRMKQQHQQINFLKTILKHFRESDPAILFVVWCCMVFLKVLSVTKLIDTKYLIYKMKASFFSRFWFCQGTNRWKISRVSKVNVEIAFSIFCIVFLYVYLYNTSTICNYLDLYSCKTLSI